jgi:hypothetical protein
LHVAVAQAPDFREGTRLVHKWVAGQGGTVLVNAENLAKAAGGFLGLSPDCGVGAFACGDEELALGAKDEA